MIEEKEKINSEEPTASVKVYVRTRDSMEDEKIRVKRSGRPTPTYADLVDEAWTEQLFRRHSTPESGGLTNEKTLNIDANSRQISVTIPVPEDATSKLRDEIGECLRQFGEILIKGGAKAAAMKAALSTARFDAKQLEASIDDLRAKGKPKRRIG